MNNDEKKKYSELFQKEKEKYKNDIELVKHYLFLDFNGNVHCLSTAYHIYLNQKIIEGLKKALDHKKVKILGLK